MKWSEKGKNSLKHFSLAQLALEKFNWLGWLSCFYLAEISS